MHEAASFVAARAVFGAGARQVYLRVARVRADLMVGDPAAVVIRISAEGVTHDPNGEVAFRRPAGMTPLPIPELALEASCDGPGARSC
jgi:hypothetical protein